ncbi:YwqI/YxiC family protein [Peribacillus frigoritolerans]|uniref:YwqI/YxiC family protein n=1 Tax=Peribacillus frigoritolerans TaxID=450367 RepID=UPI00105A4F1F|nr:YwqI/YxiC family protein [Peribacillus frigoritolerans]TDL77915.1 hypothetical protein E2R53_18665 [Peribacillus frigoritolerans]
MTQIKLNHAEMMKQLDEIKRALDALVLDGPEDAGQNKLDFTVKWQEREEMIHQFVSQYVTIVQKNVEDTRANVDSLKEQDEAIVHR